MPRAGTLTTRRKETSSSGLRQEPQVREGVLHLRALVETGPADEEVRETRPDELVLEGARLRVRPEEDGDLGPGLDRPEARDPLDDLARLVPLLREDEEGDRLASRLRRLQRLSEAAAVLGDDGPRRLEDRRGRAVVPLEADRPRPREVPLELEDVRDVGPAPAVDRLVLVADGEDVPRLSRRGASRSGPARRSCPGTRRRGAA